MQQIEKEKTGEPTVNDPFCSPFFAWWPPNENFKKARSSKVIAFYFLLIDEFNKKSLLFFDTS
jgi:hypothetical protein